MPVRATLTIDKTTLLFQEAARCTAVLDNPTGTTLKNINRGNDRKLPTLLLTHAETLEASRFARKPTFATPAPLHDLPARSQVQRHFVLSDILSFPAPGIWEIQATYEWDGGEAVSPPVRVEVQPARPRVANLASIRGGASSTSMLAWVHGRDPLREQFELWLGDVGTSGRPRAAQYVHVTGLKQPLEPFLSVPPNHVPAVQWIAWIDGDKLFQVMHRDGEVTEPDTTVLPSSGFQIIPPLLLHPQRAGEQLPGADVLLYEPSPTGTGGTLLVMLIQLAAKGGVKVLTTLPLPELDLIWARTAYLSDQSRHTFWLARSPGGGCVLKVCSWSSMRMPAAPAEVGAWDFQPLAADLLVTDEDWVRGVLLGEAPSSSGRYALYPWVFSIRHGVATGGPSALGWTDPEGVACAVARVNSKGSAFALLGSRKRPSSWGFCREDGSTVRFDGLHSPADILFRYGYDPTIMYTDPGRGFQFAKPG